MLNDRAVALYLKGKYRQALGLLQKAKKLNPRDPDIYLNLGLVHEALGSLGSAKHAYEKGLSLKPDDADLLNNLASVEYRSGDTERAVQLWQRALKMDPSHALARENLHKVSATNNSPASPPSVTPKAEPRPPSQPDEEEVIKLLEKAYKLDPEDMELALELARLYFDRKVWAKAIPLLERVSDEKNHSAGDLAAGLARRLIVYALVQQNRKEEALSRMAQWEAAGRLSPSLKETQGILQAIVGSCEEARASLAELIAQNRAGLMGRLALAECEEATGGPQAGKLWESLYRLGFEPQLTGHNYAYHAARDEATQEQARQELEELLLRFPRDSHLLRGLSHLCLSLPDYPCAKEALRRYLHLLPTDAEAHLSLGTLYLLGGAEVEKALYHLRKAAKLRPGDPEATKLLALTEAKALRGKSHQPAQAVILDWRPLSARALLKIPLP